MYTCPQLRYLGAVLKGLPWIQTLIFSGLPFESLALGDDAHVPALSFQHGFTC